jgi:putative tricarboxylic transport membrane protein
VERKNDLATGLIFMAFSLFYIWQSYSIKVFEGAGKTVINAGTIPRFWGCFCLLLLSISLVIRGLRVKKKKTGRTSLVGAVLTWTKQNYAVIGTFLLLGTYILLLKDMGFLLITPLYLFAQILLISPPGKKNPLFAAILSVTFSAAAYYLFAHALSVPLPGGLLPL